MPGVAPEFPHLLENGLQRRRRVPLGDGDAGALQAVAQRVAPQRPDVVRDRVEPAAGRVVNGTGETSITARSKPRARRSSSAPTERGSSSGDSAITSAFGGSVRRGITSISFQ